MLEIASLVFIIHRCFILQDCDTFAGSGSSLIAAEKYQMNAILTENNPAFCDAVIKKIIFGKGF